MLCRDDNQKPGNNARSAHEDTARMLGGIAIAALLLWAPTTTLAQLEWRVSVKFILDANGNRPASGSINTDTEVEAQIEWANELLRGWGRGYQIDLVEILEVDDAPDWFDRPVRSFINKTELDLLAQLQPDRFHYREDAVNIYINGNVGTGYGSKPGSGKTILIGQGASDETLFHEIGHFLDLCHTQGCLCGGCDEDEEVPIIGPYIDGMWLPCDTIPGNDQIDDTLPDIECWDRDDIANFSFSADYAALTASEQKQVDDTWFNLMSYHEDRERLTPDQLDRMMDASNTSRLDIATGKTVLVDDAALGLFPTGNSGAPYQQLDNGIDAALAGDIVLLRPGSYTEDREIRKAITLRATRGNATIRAE